MAHKYYPTTVFSRIGGKATRWTVIENNNKVFVAQKKSIVQVGSNKNTICILLQHNKHVACVFTNWWKNICLANIFIVKFNFSIKKNCLVFHKGCRGYGNTCHVLDLW